MPDDENLVKKATIRHTFLLPRKPSIDFVLLRECFLKHILNFDTNAEYPDANKDLSKIYLLQLAYRRQMYRLISLEPERRLFYTYQLNCRPAGVFVKPCTDFCWRAVHCPWCAVRQITKVCQALLAVPKAVRAQLKLVGWVRDLPYATTLPFLPGEYGPHYWFRAKVTTQTVVSRLAYNNVTGSVGLVFRHVGLQYVSADLDYPSALTRQLQQLGVECNGVNFLQPDLEDKKSATLQLLRQAFQFNWLLLFQPENLPLFQALNVDFKKQRFVRINKYKGD